MPSPRRPKLGQNFLTDDAARHRIADALGDLSTRTVLEIGPGHGAITDILAPRARRLIALELDRSLAAELTFRFRDQPHVQIVEADILKTDLTQFARTEDTIDIVGNLPYYITSDILLHLFSTALTGILARAVLMMQREVADRLTAQPGVRDFGLLSATTQLYAQVDPLFTLPPTAFTPPPDVFSSVVRLHFAPQFASFGVQPKPFDRFLHQLFAQKRKTMHNNLRAAGFPSELLAARWPAAIPREARAEQTSLAALAELFRNLHP